MASDLSVARTILEQLGGRRFIAMTGARCFVGARDSLQFRIGAGARDGINSIRVVLDPTDTYTVEAYRVRGVDFELIAAESGVYADTLQETFTRLTGFDTHL